MRLISLKFPTSLYDQKMAITITNNVQPLFLGCLHHREYYKWTALHVGDQLEGIFVALLIIVKLPAKKQHVIRTFGTA
jgi:hypothetical protein